MVENTRNEECFIREEKHAKYVVHDIYEKRVICLYEKYIQLNGKCIYLRIASWAYVLATLKSSQAMYRVVCWLNIFNVCFAALSERGDEYPPN